ncbi:MAG: glycosyltransferase family 4 protein, partial [Lachnospiraceae bacterium]|nr:glycosyltransferase family 4 protein [Lachnospiraceae bacterium]
GEKMAAKYADEIIVLSDNVRQYFMDTYQRPVTYIPNGISRPALQGSSVIEEKYGLARDGYFLFLARIVPEKGLHYLIEAFYELNTDKKLVIAGGSSQAMAYMEQIHQMAAKDGRILMTDFVQGQVLEELYANAYAFVLPSDVEGMAMTLLEAMSYGTCCLVSDIRENPEVVEDKAFTFHKGNVQDLRRQLTYLLEHPEEVRQKGAESADYICGRYDWDDVTEQTLALYERAAKRSGTEKGE